MAKKLYYENVHLKSFSGTVLSCDKAADGYAVTLDATAFYPEGGGQAGDTGYLNGVRVRDTQEADGEILHLCEAPLPVGETVRGELDWDARFRRMQQHSGDHIVSGLVHSRFGYENVGFHMGADCMTIDFSGPLTDEELREIESGANEIVHRNELIITKVYDSENLNDIAYRSKKELHGEVRLVTIPDADVCACCGTHVSATGEIGAILIIGHEKLRGGTRVELLCGQQAMEYIYRLRDGANAVSASLSVKPTEIADGVTRLQEELGSVKLQASQLVRLLTAAEAERYRHGGNLLLVRDELNNAQLGKLAAAVADTCDGVCMAVSAKEDGHFFAMAQRNGDVRPVCKEMLAKLGGRGGGKPELNQGTVACTRKELERFFAEVFAK